LTILLAVCTHIILLTSIKIDIDNIIDRVRSVIDIINITVVTWKKTTRLAKNDRSSLPPG